MLFLPFLSSRMQVSSKLANGNIIYPDAYNSQYRHRASAFEEKEGFTVCWRLVGCGNDFAWRERRKAAREGLYGHESSFFRGSNPYDELLPVPVSVRVAPPPPVNVTVAE